VLVLFWLARRSQQAPRTALLVGGSVGVAVTASTVLKAVVGRARPPAVDVLGRPENTYSFPSGHTLVAATVLLVAAYLVWSRDRRTGVALRALAWSLAGTAAVALSRLYLGYHWLSDVTASLALAVVVLGLVVVVDALVTDPASVSPRTATSRTRARPPGG
jgi:membrane-associated phospholipid phosphatase